MKKLLIVIFSIIIIIGIGSYAFIKNDSTAKGILAVNKVLDAKTPQEVKQIINDNQDLIRDFKNKGLINDNQIAKVNQALDKMQQEGKTFNKKEIVDTQLKGKLSPEQYDQVSTIVSKDKLSLQDKTKLVQILSSYKK